MRIRPRKALSLAVFAAGVLAPLCAAALTDTLMVTDLNGNVLLDTDGNPAIGTFTEVIGPPGTNQIVFELTVPDIVPFSTAGQVRMIEVDPDPTSHAPISDLVNGELFRSGDTFPALLVVQMIGFPTNRQIGFCDTVGVGQCVRETGGFQDVTAQLFPNRVTTFRVIVQSDLTPVPEPGTLALVGLGLAVVGARGGRGCRRR